MNYSNDLTPTDSLRRQLAPHGVLRAAINLSNFLLVTGRSPSGDPQGVAPDLALAIAQHLGVELELVPFETPGLLADAVVHDAWDIGLLGAEPQRAQHIAFTQAYAEIEASYLVWNDSAWTHAGELDRAGVRIAVAQRTAYELWLSRNIQRAELVLAEGFEGARTAFVAQHLDALASLKPGLLSDVQTIPGTRIVSGRFTAIQQAIGTQKHRLEAAAFLQKFVRYAIGSGLVADCMTKHRVQGLSVAALDPDEA